MINVNEKPDLLSAAGGEDDAAGKRNIVYAAMGYKA
jgi:hypothetical protein